MNSLKGKTILVVDDEEDIRDILMEGLSSHGATALCAENGTKAFELLIKQNFDAVISDARMAGGDGYTLFQNINSQLPHKPKLFLCSGFSDISKECAISLGITETFPKPFKLDRIVQSLTQALQS